MDYCRHSAFGCPTSFFLTWLRDLILGATCSPWPLAGYDLVACFLPNRHSCLEPWMWNNIKRREGGLLFTVVALMTWLVVPEAQLTAVLVLVSRVQQQWHQGPTNFSMWCGFSCDSIYGSCPLVWAWFSDRSTELPWIFPVSAFSAEVRVSSLIVKKNLDQCSLSVKLSFSLLVCLSELSHVPVLPR